MGKNSIISQGTDAEILKKHVMELLYNWMKTTPEIIECLESFAKNFQGKDIQLPNISIIGHNKLIEMQKEFKEKDLPMYTKFSISMAVITALLDDIYRGNLELNAALNLSTAEILERHKRNKNIFARMLDKIFKQPADRKSNKANTHLEEYMRICTELENYDLRTNIISSIMQYIQDDEIDEFDAEIMMENCLGIFGELGLSDLIPQLKEELEKVGKLELLGESSDNLSREEHFRQDLSVETQEPSSYNERDEKDETEDCPNLGIGHDD